MFEGRMTGRNGRAVAAGVVLALGLALMLAGCGQPAATPPKGSTAKAGAAVAKSALSTMAPDAKLLLVQTAQPTTSAGTPAWAYLFGSPSSDKTFVVYVQDGKTINAAEYGKAGLSKGEWPNVPGIESWAIDSDAAYDKATSATGLKNATYEMGMLTYLPKSTAASSTTKPFIWYVSLQSGTTTAAAEVDAKTGAAKKR